MTCSHATQKPHSQPTPTPMAMRCRGIGTDFAAQDVHTDHGEARICYLESIPLHEPYAIASLGVTVMAL
jgi:hypothetical protein